MIYRLILLIFLIICFSHFSRSNDYTYIKGPMLVNSSSVLASTGGTTNLSSSSNMIYYVTGTNSHTFKLPSTASVPEGVNYEFQNSSTQNVFIVDFSGSLISTILPNSTSKINLVSGGIWSALSSSGGGKSLNSTTPISIAQDSTSATFSIVTSSYPGVGDDMSWDGSKWDSSQYKKFYSGMVSTPTFIDNGGGNITVSSGTVNLYNNSSFSGYSSFYPVSSISATLTDGTTSYVVADYNSGTPIYRVTTLVGDINESNVVPVFTIYRSGSYLHSISWDSLGIGLSNKIHMRLVRSQRYARVSGLSISEYGTRNYSISSGIVYIGASPITVNDFYSSQTATNTVFYMNRTASSTWSQQTVSQYNNTDYFNGTTTASLTNNRYAVNWVYRGIESQNHSYIVLGEGDYTLSQAQSEQPPVSIPQIISSHAMLVGKIIVLKGASSSTEIDSAFNVNFTQGLTTDHESLSNLLGGSSGDHNHLTTAQVSSLSTFATTASLNYATTATAVNTSLLFGYSKTGSLPLSSSDSIISAIGKLENSMSSGNPSLGLTFQSISGTTASMTVGYQYVTTSASTTTTQMPNSCTSGDRLAVLGGGSGGYRILSALVDSTYKGDDTSVTTASTATTTVFDATASKYASCEWLCASNNNWIMRTRNGGAFAGAFFGTSSDTYTRSDSNDNVGGTWSTETYHNRSDSSSYMGIVSNRAGGSSGTNGRGFFKTIYDASTLNGDWTYQQKVQMIHTSFSSESVRIHQGSIGIAFGCNTNACNNSGVAVFVNAYSNGNILSSEIMLTTGGFFLDNYNSAGVPDYGNGTLRTSVTVDSSNDYIHSGEMYFDVRKRGTIIQARLYRTTDPTPDWQLTYDYAAAYTPPSNKWGQVFQANANVNTRVVDIRGDNFTLQKN